MLGRLRTRSADARASRTARASIERAGRRRIRRVHVDGTHRVIEAARQAGVSRLALMSFLRARPACGSPYHESKWAAEELVRASGLDYTVIKAGVIYGAGDHLLEHASRALKMLPVFALVGRRPRPMRPVAVEDVARILIASLVEGRLSRRTVAVTGPEELSLENVVQRVGCVIGRRPWIVPLPVACHYALGWVMERVMAAPLASFAQVRMLAEGLVEPWPPCDPLPDDLRPATPFDVEHIRRAVAVAQSG